MHLLSEILWYYRYCKHANSPSRREHIMQYNALALILASRIQREYARAAEDRRRGWRR